MGWDRGSDGMGNDSRSEGEGRMLGRVLECHLGVTLPFLVLHQVSGWWLNQPI